MPAREAAKAELAPQLLMVVLQFSRQGMGHVSKHRMEAEHFLCLLYTPEKGNPFMQVTLLCETAATGVGRLNQDEVYGEVQVKLTEDLSYGGLRDQLGCEIAIWDEMKASLS